MKEVKVYCIIVTYNAMKWVDKCLGSLRESSCPVIPVIIDNCSKDDTVTYIRENYPEAHLIVNSENKGFGQANNQGIEWAYKEGATHFFLLNQDAWVEKETLQNLLEIQENNDFDIVSPIHLNGAGSKIDRGFQVLAINGSADFTSDAFLNELHDYYIVQNVNAAAWLMKTSTILTIGGFDPLYFHYGEDTNYIQRLKYHHKRMAIIPTSIIYHDRGEHGNVEVYKKGLLKRMLFDNYADINHPFLLPTVQKSKLFFKIIFMVIESLLRLRFTISAFIVSDCIGFCHALPKILRSRKTNKEVRPNWLSI